MIKSLSNLPPNNLLKQTKKLRMNLKGYQKAKIAQTIEHYQIFQNVQH